MGTVRKYGKHKPWTPKEEEQLKKLCEKYTKSDIARIMKRTQSSVNSKRIQLGLKPFMNTTEKWTFRQIEQSVGLSGNTVSKTWVKHGLIFKKYNNFCLVEEKDLHKFMQEHTDLWDATKCDYYLFCQYEWFVEKLKQDKKQPMEQKQHYWTDYQKRQFDILARRGYSYREIAKEIGKTKSAVEHYASRAARKT